MSVTANMATGITGLATPKVAFLSSDLSQIWDNGASAWRLLSGISNATWLTYLIAAVERTLSDASGTGDYSATASNLASGTACVARLYENPAASTDVWVAALTDLDGVVLAASEDVYHADVFLTRDALNSRDEYTVQWYKNGTPVTSGVTSPTIQVVKRTDGTNLVVSTAMTQIGATGAYKYDSTIRLTGGEAAVAVVQATIDGAVRTWRRPVGRDI